MEAEPYINHLLEVFAANWIWNVAALMVGLVVGWLSCPPESHRQVTR
jgi:hypothetical protein